MSPDWRRNVGEIIQLVKGWQDHMPPFIAGEGVEGMPPWDVVVACAAVNMPTISSYGRLLSVLGRSWGNFISRDYLDPRDQRFWQQSYERRVQEGEIDRPARRVAVLGGHQGFFYCFVAIDDDFSSEDPRWVYWQDDDGWVFEDKSLSEVLVATARGQAKWFRERGPAR